MPLLKHCCWCCQLKTGGIILGCVEFILSLLIVGVCGVTVSYPDILTPDIAAVINPASINPGSVEQTEAPANPKTDVHDIAVGLNLEMELELNKEKHLQVSVSIAAVVGLVCGTMNVKASIFLIEGAAKNNPFLLLPSLILKMTGIAINVLRDIYIISLGLYPAGCGALLVEGLNFYFWLVVLSLYKELRKNHCPRDESKNTARAQALQVL